MLTRELESGFNAFDDDEWVLRLVEYAKKILAQNRIRIIGVCYGHQIVGRALGAKVARSGGGAWEASVCDVRLTSKGKELFRKDVLVCFRAPALFKLAELEAEYLPDAQRYRLFLSARR